VPQRALASPRLAGEDRLTMSNDTRWADARRIEGFAGEVRVNLIRLAAIVVFYAHHLINVFLIRDDPTLTGGYHVAVTVLVVAWACAVLALHYCLTRRWVPRGLKYVATAWDLLLITTVLLIGRDPRSTLTSLYFLVIAAAALRLSLALVWVATLGAMACYAYFLGYVKFWLELPDAQRLPRAQQVVFLLALGAAGILAGQMVRQARRLVQGYPVTVVEKED
jgi:hypothetical protein